MEAYEECDSPDGGVHRPGCRTGRVFESRKTISVAKCELAVSRSNKCNENNAPITGRDGTTHPDLKQSYRTTSIGSIQITPIYYSSRNCTDDKSVSTERYLARTLYPKITEGTHIARTIQRPTRREAQLQTRNQNSPDYILHDSLHRLFD